MVSLARRVRMPSGLRGLQPAPPAVPVPLWWGLWCGLGCGLPPPLPRATARAAVRVVDPTPPAGMGPLARPPAPILDMFAGPPPPTENELFRLPPRAPAAAAAAAAAATAAGMLGELELCPVAREPRPEGPPVSMTLWDGELRMSGLPGRSDPRALITAAGSRPGCVLIRFRTRPPVLMSAAAGGPLEEPAAKSGGHKRRRVGDV